MNLHRSGRRPDWRGYPRRRWNMWQRLADKTHGALTPGNIFTIVGLLLVVAGLVAMANGRLLFGLLLAGVGRACDLLDGWLADKTGTKSPLGEKLDAGADKLETLAAVAVLVVADFVPLWAALALMVPQLCIAGASMLAVRRSADGSWPHPQRLGKLNMALAWLVLGGFVIVRQLPNAAFRQDLKVALVVLVILSVVVSLRIAWRYAKVKKND